MSAAEIISELAHLGPDDLAAVRAWLDQQHARAAAPPTARPYTPVRLRSPRLADPAHSRDFAKQIVNPTDAAV